MKLIIQIPCYNEEKTLPLTLSELPKHLKGISEIEILIIDDGSIDRTIEIAKQHHVHHIVRHTKNQGLAKTFMLGIETALEKGADIIVNTDADNQYNAKDIEKLIEPILNKRAEIVIGERPITQTVHFSPLKKMLQKLGSLVVRWVSDTHIPDAPSGFRAMSRNAAMKLNVFTPYTYTIEMIIQAGKNGLALESVPIRTNKDERPSRLVKSIPKYIQNTILTLLRIFNTYSPMRFFIGLSLIPLSIGIGLGIRWILSFMGKGQALHIPSLILATLLILIGTQLLIFGFMADLIAVNRKLLQDIQYRQKRLFLNDTNNE